MVSAAWDVIARRSRSIASEPPAKPLAFDVAIPGLPARSQSSSRPCSTSLLEALDTCSRIQQSPALLEHGLVPHSSVTPSLRQYSPSSGATTFLSARPPAASELRKQVASLDVSSQQFRQLVQKGDHFLTTANFTDLISDSLQVLCDLEAWDQTALSDVQCLVQALRLVSRNFNSLAATNAVSLCLLHREALLSRSGLPSPVKTQCRSTPLQPSRTFGPEADKIVEEYKASPSSMLQSVLQRKRQFPSQSSRQNTKKRRLQSVIQPARRWNADPRDFARRQNPKLRRGTSGKTSAPTESGAKQRS